MRASKEHKQWLTDMHIIESAPSIDIVFCKECKHWTKWSDEEMFCGCLDGGIGSDADDFCSYGERKESE